MAPAILIKMEFGEPADCNKLMIRTGSGFLQLRADLIVSNLLLDGLCVRQDSVTHERRVYADKVVSLLYAYTYDQCHNQEREKIKSYGQFFPH